ncbi:hypothetical protein D3C72_2522790 [compost metagenome]
MIHRAGDLGETGVQLVEAGLGAQIDIVDDCINQVVAVQNAVTDDRLGLARSRTAET